MCREYGKLFAGRLYLKHSVGVALRRIVLAVGILQIFLIEKCKSRGLIEKRRRVVRTSARFDLGVPRLSHKLRYIVSAGAVCRVALLKPYHIGVVGKIKLAELSLALFAGMLRFTVPVHIIHHDADLAELLVGVLRAVFEVLRGIGGERVAVLKALIRYRAVKKFVAYVPDSRLIAVKRAGRKAESAVIYAEREIVPVGHFSAARGLSDEKFVIVGLVVSHDRERRAVELFYLQLKPDCGAVFRYRIVFRKDYAEILKLGTADLYRAYRVVVVICIFGIL